MKHLNINIVGKDYDEFLDDEGNTYRISELYNGTIVLEFIGGGFTFAKYETLTTEDEENIKQCEYVCETVSCKECGALHDSDASSWTVINECEAICCSCQTAEDVLIDLNNPSDLLEAKFVPDDMNLYGYEEIECLFCDASGFGQEWERALTKQQAEIEVRRILAKYPNDTLKVGITGVGQFQVWVSIFKKVI